MDIWLDCDPGFDDWMAWALLQADAGLRLHGVGVVAGNAPLSRTMANALAIRRFHGWATPVYAGCDRPLAQAQVTAQNVLGDQGMATTGPALPLVHQAADAGHAVQALIDCVRAHPGRITLLAIGPLTNVATAFAQAPELPALLHRLVIMGGSAGPGNATAAAEFNIHADPEAAAQVFECGVPVHMFGLDVCRQVPVAATEVQALRDLSTPHADLFAGYLDAYVDIARQRGRPAQPLYDPVPVAWLSRPDLFELQAARVDVELQGRFTRGMTVCDLRKPALARANARLAVKARGDEVLRWMMAQLAQTLQP